MTPLWGMVASVLICLVLVLFGFMLGHLHAAHNTRR